MQTKYIFVTGGVVSGLGKGITAASLGRLLKARGYKVTSQKFDPYINIDPGTMSPFQHGEVFVTDDGAETDLDVGHYERFIDENLTVSCNITTGKIYWSVLNKERKGEFNGETVQVIPHITNVIKEMVHKNAKADSSDVVITEIGGTVGDIESLPFIEAIRQLAFDVGRENILYIHVTLIPYLASSGEMKTKPTQHSVKELLSIGVQPDILVCRTERELPKEMCDKIARFCNVSEGCVIPNYDAQSLYEVPLLLEREGLAEMVCKKLQMNSPKPDLVEWEKLVARQKNITKKIKIALVGKYVELHDAYLSIVESLNHAGIHNDCDVEIMWIDAEKVELEGAQKLLSDASGILVPGGFGERGVEGKILAAKFARENKIPYFGICLGMQCAIIEFARNVVGFADANTSEFAPEVKHDVISLMDEQKDVDKLGGTMRLGAYPCQVADETILKSCYNKSEVSERHRHRYEVNNKFRSQMVEKGLIVSGTSPDGELVEAIELSKKEHPWFVGVQFHPEFKSRPNKPHPVFFEFVKASLNTK